MKITLLITTHQRAKLLRQSLERLEEITLPDELIVVDDGGSDETPDVVAAFEQSCGIDVTYIYTHNPGPSICSHARNVGLKAARNEWIATAEPELCFRTDVLAQFAQLQSGHPGDVISAGHIWFAPDGYQFSGQLPQGAKEAVGWVAPYAALWGRRQALLDLGGWDEGFPGCWGWDDTDLLTRLRISGHGQHIATEVEAIHLFHGLGRDENSVNEQHFYRKSFTHGQEKHQCSAECQADPDQTRDLIANRGRAWGEPKPRP